MTDVFTHVLVGYILGTLLSIRFDWLTPQFVTICMLGATVPDLTKIQLLVSSEQVEVLLGVPFDWYALHTIGGSVLVVSAGTFLVGRDYRKAVFGLLLLGALSHLCLDALLLNPSGYSNMFLFPITSYNPPTPGLYLSSDRWPALVAGTLAIAVWYLRYRVFDSEAVTGTETVSAGE